MAGVGLGGLPAAAAGSLPDQRGYELVSPAIKGGGDVMADSGRTRTAVSGDAVNFASLAAFGDTLGTGISTEYVSQRTGVSGTSGWATHAIMPQLNPLSLGAAFHGKDSLYQSEFSDDLSEGVLHSYTPLTNDPNVATVPNLYLRQDLLTAGVGSYALLSACPGCGAPLGDPTGFNPPPQVAAATPDFTHVIFEEAATLTADAAPQSTFPCLLFGFGCTPELYEWDHGTLRFVGILPNGSAAPISIAGTGAWQRLYTVNTISGDGRKIFFTVPPNESSSSGDLYMRLDHTTTVQLNASERTDCADNDPCSGAPELDPGGPQPARFQAASVDGDKVFFTSDEQLTDTPGGDLYVYDTTLPASDPHNISRVYVDDQPADGSTPASGVIGTSSDGSYLYFTDGSALIAGQPDLSAAAPLGIYAWHDGTIAFVGSIDFDAANTDSLGRPWGLHLGARVTPDGRSLLFGSQSGAGLTGYDHGHTCGALTSTAPCNELYLYRADAASLACISCNSTGATATTNATFTVRASTGGAASSSHLNHSITDEGNRIFFETGERLLPQDGNGKHADVYEWTATGVGDCQPSSPGFTSSAGGCLSLISTGASSDDSHFLDASPSGHDVFFSTNQRLNGWDTDNNGDLYDARIGGGLPDPVPAPTECTGQDCHGLLASPPPSPPTSSSIFRGRGNRSTHRKVVVKRCHKGKVRRRVHGKAKCVKKPRHRVGKGAAGAAR